jgi:hypothetical protein
VATRKRDPDLEQMRREMSQWASGRHLRFFLRLPRRETSTKRTARQEGDALDQWVRLASASVIAVATSTLALQAIAGSPVGGAGYVLLGVPLLAAGIAVAARGSPLALGVAALLLAFSATLLLLGGVGFLLLPAIIIYVVAAVVAASRAARDRRGSWRMPASRSSSR